MNKDVFLKQDPKESLWNHEQLLFQILEDQRTLAQQLATLGQTLDNLPAADLEQEPPHPYGLCGDTGCESCVQAGQAIVEKARAAFLDELDRVLLAAADGRPEARDGFIRVIQAGQAKLAQAAGK